MIDLEKSESHNEIWEPFQPEIGSVVRIKIGGECNITMDGRATIGQGRIIDTEKQLHPASYNNNIGVVVSIDKGNAAKGHYYRVMTVKPISDSKGDHLGGDFAALELEYIERHLTLDEWMFVRNTCNMFSLPYPEYWSIHRIIKDGDNNDKDIVVCMGSLTDNVCGPH